MSGRSPSGPGSRASHGAASSTASPPEASIPNAVADRLRKARELIEPKGAWTQYAYSRDAKGNAHMRGTAPSAVCWCALGAIDKACHGTDLWHKAVRFLSEATGAKLPQWNDVGGRTQSEVLAAFDRAIELAEAGQ